MNQTLSAQLRVFHKRFMYVMSESEKIDYSKAIQRILGQDMFSENDGTAYFMKSAPELGSAKAHLQTCGGCGASGAEKKLNVCTRCRKKWYCGKECQAGDWKSHKPHCKKP